MNASTQTGTQLGWTQLSMSSSPELMDGFIALYIKAFAEKPYFETYGIEEVYEEVLVPHLRDGVVVVAVDRQRDDKVIGLGCAMPFNKCPDDVREFLGSHHLLDFHHHQAWYMSELAVLKEYRSHGIGYEMVLQRAHLMEERGASQYFMRTAAVESNSLHLYLKIGSQLIEGQHDVSETDQATENNTQALERIYLWGDCQQAVENIERIKLEHGYISIRSV